MTFISDIELMAAQGLPSPFIAADAMYSPISEGSLMTHRIFPGLSGFVPSSVGMVAGVFVDQLPDTGRLKGLVMLTSRSDATGEAQECWLVQLQSTTNAWQFMTIDENLKEPADKAVLFQWKPGALNDAYEMHEAMISGLADHEQFWLVGSEIEKQAYSRFVLSTGYSSVAHPYQASGAIEEALSSLGSTLIPQHGPCLSLRAYGIDWYQV